MKYEHVLANASSFGEFSNSLFSSHKKFHTSKTQPILIGLKAEVWLSRVLRYKYILMTFISLRYIYHMF